MENQNQSKDQLCHIFSYGEKTLCLICKIILSGANTTSKRHKRISTHLESTVHKECMRKLFKMCFSDPVCDVDNEKYLNIVIKSIFDISVLLGEESSYICQKEDHLVCLMCDSPISEIKYPFAQMKERLFQHLDSTLHYNSVKEVCWYYRLNSEKDFLLLYKSIWHCSVCEETLECEETKLLQSVIRHVESNSHEIKQHLREVDLEKDNRNCEISGNNLFMCESFNQSGFLGTLNRIKLEGDSEKINDVVEVKPNKQRKPRLNSQQDVAVDTAENKNSESIVSSGRQAQYTLCYMCSQRIKSKNIIFGTCMACLRKTLDSLYPGLEVIGFRIRYRGKCICTPCEKIISAENFDSLLKSCFHHTQAEEHKKLLKTFLRRKEKRRLKRIKRKQTKLKRMKVNQRKRKPKQ